MIRLPARLTGLIVAAGLALGMATPALSAGSPDAPRPSNVPWSFSNPFWGMFDRAQLQRGFQVYKEVCSSCHGMELLRYRNLGERGGPEFPEAMVKALAAQYRVTELNDRGEPAERPAEAKDPFQSPFPNKLAAAAANNGKAPPDLSVIAKARTYFRGFPLFVVDLFTGENLMTGPNYLYAFLTGYQEPPAGVEVVEGAHYNRYFPGNWVGMPNILADGQIQYQDNSPQTVSQYARDVTAFMYWAAEPKMEERKRMGMFVILFLIFFATLLYFTKKKVWASVKGH